MSRVLLLVGVAVVTFVLALLWWWQYPSGGSEITREPELSRNEADNQIASASAMADADVGVAGQMGSTARFELADLTDVQIGEVITFFLPQENREIRLTVSETRRTRAGNRVVIAEQLRAGIYHRLILTIGQFESFGNIQTDRDRYQFAIAEGTGDIHAVSAMQRRLNESTNDFVVRTPAQESPPEQKLPEKIEVSP